MTGESTTEPWKDIRRFWILGTAAHYLFRDINKAAYLTHFMNDITEPGEFTQALLKFFGKNGPDARLLKPDRPIIVVDECIWLQVLAAEADRRAVLTNLRQLLKTEGVVLVAYVLQLGEHLRWGRVQIPMQWLRPEEELTLELSQVVSKIGHVKSGYWRPWIPKGWQNDIPDQRTGTSA
jgi:hypothetical protein